MHAALKQIENAEKGILVYMNQEGRGIGLLNKLKAYVPEAALDQVLTLFDRENISLEVVPSRVTRHGDYRQMPHGGHVITINHGENQYRFLLTLIH